MKFFRKGKKVIQMKKKLLALILSVVMLTALLVPVLVASAAAPTMKISLGTPTLTDRNGVKVIAVPVLVSDNTSELFTLRYQVLGSNGIETYYDADLFDEGYDEGDFTQKYGNKICNFAVTINTDTETEGKNGFQVVMDAVGGPAGRGVATAAGTLITVYFKAPTAVGDYNFEVVWLDGANNDAVAYEVAVGAGATYTVECKEHVKGEAEQTKAPTCDEKGEAVVKCTECGKVIETKEVAALGHTEGEPEQTKAPTCTEKGEAVVKCTVCGDVLKTNAVEMIPHDMIDDAEANKAPTCTEDGVKNAKKCSVCGHKESEVAPALGHDMVDDAEANKEATCTEAGVANAKKCTRCDHKTHDVVVALGHAWDEGVVDGDAKCGETSNITYTCVTCGETRVEIGAVVEHVLVKDDANSVDPTCTEDGVEVLKCTREGCDYTTEPAVVEKLGHDMVADEANSVAATCTEKGVEATKCTRCDVTDSKEIAALGHKAGEDEVTKAPTCTEKGEAVVKCTVCEEVLETKELDMVAHTEGEKEVTKAPTDAEEGKWEIKCTVCDALIDSGAIAKLEKVVEDKENGFTFEAEDAKLPSDFTADVETNEEEGKVTVTLNFKSDIVELKGEVVMTIDTAIFNQFKKLAVFTTNAAGELVEVEVEIKDGIATFNADLEKEYIFAEAEDLKEDSEVPGTSDNANVAVFAVVALMAVAALVVVGKKRFAL